MPNRSKNVSNHASDLWVVHVRILNRVENGRLSTLL
jgi:hypothetical protein